MPYQDIQHTCHFLLSLINLIYLYSGLMWCAWNYPGRPDTSALYFNSCYGPVYGPSWYTLHVHLKRACILQLLGLMFYKLNVIKLCNCMFSSSMSLYIPSLLLYLYIAIDTLVSIVYPLLKIGC